MTLRSRTAAVVAVLALVLSACGDSPEDTAHDNGEDVGQALRSLMNADDADALRSAGDELRGAVAESVDDAGDRLRQQIQVQVDHLNAAIGNFRTATTATDADAAAAARTELQAEVQQARSQAAGFRDTGSSVTNAFWQGVRDGFDG